LVDGNAPVPEERVFRVVEFGGAISVCIVCDLVIIPNRLLNVSNYFHGKFGPAARNFLGLTYCVVSALLYMKE
jgi:hypothetical protein